MQDIKQALQNKREEVARLRRLLSDLRKAEDELTILEKAYQLLGGETNENSDSTLSLDIVKNQKNVTIADASERVLDTHGRPMNVKDIHSQIREKYGINTTRAAVMSGISRDIKIRKRFVKTMPGTFGLSKWKDKNEETEGIVIEAKMGRE
jgi:hypothetical protein